ncbi:MAG TPA: fasciclin domain-containing protein [Polyangiaceae bacterium LLY-WYZ-14_1]|nr:fasciclin domain-containing protein [Polyangiaceae bacterium LLY-WYZ-14_1]
MKRALTLAPLGLLALAAACGDDGGPADDDDDAGMGLVDAGPQEDAGPDAGMMDEDGGPMLPPVVGAISAEPTLSTLAAFLLELDERGLIGAELLALLDGGTVGPTVFAPENSALDPVLTARGITDVTAATDEELLALLDIVAYHVVDGELTAAEIAALSPPVANSIRGAGEGPRAGIRLYFDTSDGVAVRFVDEDGMEASADVTAADVPVPGDDDAVIHRIDEVLLPPDVVGVATLEGLTGLLTAAGDAANLPDGGPSVAEALRDPEGAFTVFAPENAAFEGVDATGEALRDTLLHHVLALESGPALSDGLPDVTESLAGFAFFVDGTTLNGGPDGIGANILATDIQATNGVVHLISDVMGLPTLADVATLGGLSALVTQIGNVDAGQPESEQLLPVLAAPDAELTVFAPNDAAFAGLDEVPPVDALRDIIRYHLVSGSVIEASDLTDPAAPVTGASSALEGPGEGRLVELFFDGTTINGGSTDPDAIGAAVVTPDLRAVNGVAHVIDAVLTPPNVAQLAGLVGLTELLEAVGTADMDATGEELLLSPILTDPASTLTVFAPTDVAFGALPTPGPGPDVLRDVLLYHVLLDDLTSGELGERRDSALEVTLLFDGTVINGGSTGDDAIGASVVLADVVATNGVVHTIDAVLTPPDVAQVLELEGLSGVIEAIGVADAAADEPGEVVIDDLITDPASTLTVLAPTNDAVDGVRPFTPGDELRAVLLYHVVTDEVLDIAALSEMDGMSLDVAFPGLRAPIINVLSPGEVTFTDAIDDTIEIEAGRSDLRTTNGIIHVVDEVLFPAPPPGGP